MLTVSASRAADIAFILAGSVRNNSATTDLPNANVSSHMSFGAGVLGVAPLRESLALRSGFMLVQRYVDIAPTNVGTTHIQFSYIDIPITPMWLFTSEAGLFAGPVIAMNVVKDCSSTTASCGATNVKSVAIPLTIGVQARLFDQLGAEVFFEKTSGDLADHVSDFSTVGANLLFYFE
jgi:hypothetical protein